MVLFYIHFFVFDRQGCIFTSLVFGLSPVAKAELVLAYWNHTLHFKCQ